MATQPVPTLSTVGLVSSISEKCDRLLSYFFTNEAAQSELYAGNVVSLPAIIQEFGNDRMRLTEEIRERSRDYLTGYFDQVEVEVSVADVSEDDNRTNITMTLYVTSNGERYSFGRRIELIDSIISGILDTNNNG